ncbi:hypothetical protein LCGC14_1267340 [marine sediment metagenome]|uniref:Fibronectin type-III domain-containing protein n=1 Tax=marine sediment metagenome TaxID=412755 RepID=A0A0F9P2A5_9ZZZZ
MGENLTTYTQGGDGPGNPLTITSTKVIATDINLTQNVYLSDDKGAGFFSGNFIHYFTLKPVSSGSSINIGTLWSPWGMANALGNVQNLAVTQNETFVVVAVDDYQSIPRINLLRWVNGNQQASDPYDAVWGTTYYCKVVRDEAVGANGTQYLYIYSDAARTSGNLLDTQSFEWGSKIDFQYLYATISRDNNQSQYKLTGEMENLILDNWGGDFSQTSPTVTSQAVTAISTTTATANGNVTALGNPPATQYGHVWATHSLPTTLDSKTEKGVPSATGAYTSSMTNLTANQLYFVRPYIISSLGTFYGQRENFTTSASTPVVTTIQPADVAATTATGKGFLHNLGGSSVTAHGLVWGTSANPDTSDSKTDAGATTTLGEFYDDITELSANTLYHVRAYVTNTSGTAYGADLTFTTLAAGVPIVTAQPATDVQPTTATGNATIVSEGASSVTEHGHCWSTSVNPTTSDSKTTNGAGAIGPFTSYITGMTAGTAYYIRPYATNGEGTAYGDNELINSITTIVPPGTAPGSTPGVCGVLDEHWVYISATGKQRSLLGTEF